MHVGKRSLMKCDVKVMSFKAKRLNQRYNNDVILAWRMIKEQKREAKMKGTSDCQRHKVIPLYIEKNKSISHILNYVFAFSIHLRVMF